MCKGSAVIERLTANSCASTLPPGQIEPHFYGKLKPVFRDRFLNYSGKAYVI